MTARPACSLPVDCSLESPLSSRFNRVGIYVDSHYVLLNGGFRVNLGSLVRSVQKQPDAEIVKATVYSGFDPDRATRDPQWFQGFRKYRERVARDGFDLYEKVPKLKVRKGVQFTEADCDPEIAGDMAMDCWDLGIKRVILVSGDKDYARTVKRLKKRSVFVEVIGLKNVSSRLKSTANRYTSGYDIPGFVRVEDPPKAA